MVERQLPKLYVVGSIPIARSNTPLKPFPVDPPFVVHISVRQKSRRKPAMSKTKAGRKPEPSQVTYSEFRDRLAAYMDQVWESRAPLHVTRQGGRAVVVMAEEEFEGWMETVHLLRSPANARRLLQSIVAANAGKLAKHDVIEPEE